MPLVSGQRTRHHRDRYCPRLGPRTCAAVSSEGAETAQKAVLPSRRWTRPKTLPRDRLPCQRATMLSTHGPHWSSGPNQRVSLDPDTFLGSGLAILMGSPGTGHTLQALPDHIYFLFEFMPSDNSPVFAEGLSERFNGQFEDRLKGLTGRLMATPAWSTELRRERPFARCRGSARLPPVTALPSQSLTRHVLRKTPWEPPPLRPRPEDSVTARSCTSTFKSFKTSGVSAKQFLNALYLSG